MQELIATGKTVDDAVASACAQLGLSRDAVNVEVLELPKKKLFGSVPAKVRVTERDDVFSIHDLLTGVEEKKKETKPEPKKVAAPRTEKPAQEPKKQEKPQVAAPAPAPKAAPVPKAEPQREAVQPTAAPAAQPVEAAPVESAEPEVEIPLEELSAPAAAALTYFKEMAQGMGATRLTYKVVKTERGVKFVIDGDDASLVIGRRGETMDAMQYLCMLVSSRTEGEYCKITVDVAGYRSKREKTLIALAKKEAAKVLRTRYDEVLEPMNPYERRIVHSAVQEIEGVKSESTGTEPHRRVVISLESGGRSRRDRGGRGGRRDGRDRDRAPRRDRSERPAAPAAPVETLPADNTNIDMLYKKIEL